MWKYTGPIIKEEYPELYEVMRFQYGDASKDNPEDVKRLEEALTRVFGPREVGVITEVDTKSKTITFGKSLEDESLAITPDISVKREVK